MVVGLLLVFNHQGGKQKAGEQKQSDPNNLETTTNKVIFPIAFKSKPLYVHPYAVNKAEMRHLSRIGFSESQITATGFMATISENSNAIEQIKMRYIALGVLNPHNTPFND